ncbi:hypothetical protein, partial [Streptomyces brasiliscabiei]|uniref:hypothetical protein n=1 Tax=Streptomyces brasiliscabiei TaxID=2736302 RepID=UPI003014B93E
GPEQQRTEQQNTQQQAASQRTQQGIQEITLELQEPVRLQALLEYAEQQLNQQREEQGQGGQDIYWPAARLIVNDRQAEAEAARNA